MQNSQSKTFKSSYSVTDREKFQVLAAVYPDRYFNRNICAKYVGVGNQIFKKERKLAPLLKSLVEQLQYDKLFALSKEQEKDTVNAIGYLVEPEIDRFMQKGARDTTLRKEFKARAKQFNRHISAISYDKVMQTLKALLTTINTEKESDESLTQKLLALLERPATIVVKRIFNKGAQTVNIWENQEGKIPNSELKKSLARMFEMQYKIWDEIPTIQLFKHTLAELEKPKMVKEEKNKLDKKILGEIAPI